MNNSKIIWLIIGVIALGGLLWWGGSATRIPESTGDVIATNGLHWHPTLSIFVDGEKQEIPANVGLVGGHQPMHTHAEDSAQGVIHLEFGSMVRADDVRLGNFFRIWNKDMMTAFGTLERMTVNGSDNTEYGNYQIQGEDKIELHYSSSVDTQ